MNVKRTEREVGGFRAIQLANESVAIVVMPDLGAKIVSLRNLVSGREWCWHPGRTLELFTNEYGASFGDSPHVGINECFPTIEGCQNRGRSLPCHGEVWSEGWTVNDDDKNAISVEISPRQSPFILKRRISVAGHFVRLDYFLENKGSSTEMFLWALHPLFRIIPGDRLELPKEVSLLTVGASAGFPFNPSQLAWPSPFPNFDLDLFALGENEESRLKAFTSPLKEGWSRIANVHSIKSRGQILPLCSVIQHPKYAC